VLVYGDPQFSASADTLARELATAQTNSRDAARAYLIRAGQLEQGIEDCPLATPEQRLGARALTDHAARLFLEEAGHSPLRQAPSPPPPIAIFPGNYPLHVKFPEGFEFYTLYPEQYIAAAEQWARHAQSKPVLVVGIRSIGTTLSAVVKAALEAGGFQAFRITCRPYGHPFSRRVELNVGATDFDQAIAVDEGPGLSGSSMAAVHSALTCLGIKKITFMPGHAGEPGEAASGEIKRCWSSTPKIVVPLSHVRWGKMSLEELLSQRPPRSRVFRQRSP